MNSTNKYLPDLIPARVNSQSIPFRPIKSNGVLVVDLEPTPSVLEEYFKQVVAQRMSFLEGNTQGEARIQLDTFLEKMLAERDNTKGNNNTETEKIDKPRVLVIE